MSGGPYRVLIEIVDDATKELKRLAEQLKGLQRLSGRLKHAWEHPRCRTCNPRGNPAPLARGLIKGSKR